MLHPHTNLSLVSRRIVPGGSVAPLAQDGTGMTRAATAHAIEHERLAAVSAGWGPGRAGPPLVAPADACLLGFDRTLRRRRQLSPKQIDAEQDDADGDGAVRDVERREVGHVDEVDDVPVAEPVDDVPDRPAELEAERQGKPWALADHPPEGDCQQQDNADRQEDQDLSGALEGPEGHA